MTQTGAKFSRLHRKKKLETERRKPNKLGDVLNELLLRVQESTKHVSSRSKRRIFFYSQIHFSSFLLFCSRMEFPIKILYKYRKFRWTLVDASLMANRSDIISLAMIVTFLRRHMSFILISFSSVSLNPISNYEECLTN